MSAEISVVVVHWNQAEACLETVGSFAQQPEVGRIMVVDNGSRVDELGLLRTRLGDVAELIEVGANSGFGPAANRGWERWLGDPMGGEWCVVSPHDARPLPGTLGRMLDAAEGHPEIGILSADVGDLATPFVDHVFGPITRPAGTTQGFEEADYPHGTLLMARRECVGDIGVFDERYFAYCEEADLGLRARKAGWSVGIVRGARVVNTTVSSPHAVVDYLMQRNTLLLLRDHFGRRKMFMRAAIGVWQLAVGVVRPSRRSLFFSAKARTLALLDVARGRYGPPPRSVLR